MGPPRPLLLCALLALAAHAAMLRVQATAPAARDAGGGRAELALLHVNLVSARPTAPSPVTAAPPPPSVGVDGNAVASASSQMPERALSTPRVFVGEAPRTTLPDAFLPDAGVQVRALVQVDGSGQSVAVQTAARPTDAPPAYEEITAIVLRDARFVPQSQKRWICLQLEFLPGSMLATWAWRPASTAERCLDRPSGAAHPLSAPG